MIRMRMIRMIELKSSLLVLVLAFPGCFQEAVQDSGALQKSNEESIVVVTTDGWRYRFSGGEYSVVADSSGQEAISGEGQRYRKESSHTERFSGAIPFNVIEKVTTREIPTSAYFIWGILAGTGAVVIYLAIRFQGFKVG